MYQRFYIALPDQLLCFIAVVTGTADTELDAFFIDNLYDVVLFKLSFNGCDAD